MDVSSLQAFLAAARSGSITAAAEALGIPAAVVRRHIGQLELELRSELATASGDALTITEAGRVFMERAAQIVRRVEFAKTGMREQQLGVGPAVARLSRLARADGD